jgi:hypothetical protein
MHANDNHSTMRSGAGRLVRTPSASGFLSLARGVALCLLPVIAGAQGLDTDSKALHSIYLGIDGTFVRATTTHSPNQTRIAAPTQSFHLGTAISDAFRIELPVRLLVTKTSGDDAVTELSTGLMLDVFPARLTGGSRADQFGFFAGGGPLAEYLHSSDVTRKQFGVAGRAGYELALDDLHLRFAGLFEQRFKTEEIPQTRRYGGSIGISFPVTGDAARMHGSSSNPGRWYVQARTGINRQTQDDSPATTTVWLPKPFFSVFYFPGKQRRAALGVRTHVDYLDGSDLSNRYVQVAPRAEINLLPHSGSRTGIQVGAHAIVDRLSLSSSIADFTSTYYGAGGDVSVTVPVMPTMFKIGIGFDVDAAGGKPRRPSGTNLRLDIAVDRFITHKAAHN